MHNPSIKNELRIITGSIMNTCRNILTGNVASAEVNPRIRDNIGLYFMAKTLTYCLAACRLPRSVHDLCLSQKKV